MKPQGVLTGTKAKRLTQPGGIFALVLFLAAVNACQAQSYVFTPIDHPLGVKGTYAQGISGNKIVGVYYDSSYGSHGFVYDGTSFTTIDPTNSQLTNIRGIYGNRMVGYFQNAVATQGFIYDGTNYTFLNHPNAINGTHGTYAYGIYGSNNVVGYYLSNNIAHGFSYNGTNYTTIDYPTGTYGTYLQGIYGTNMVGLAYDVALGVGHSFLYNGSSFITLSNSPGALDAFGVSSSGKIVGYSYDGNVDHGFIYDGTNTVVIDHPTAAWTAIQGIDGDNLVGIYFDSPTQVHGFVAKTAVSAPKLYIVSGAGEVSLQWSTNSPGFVLAQTPTLPLGGWTDISTIPTTAGSNFSITLPLGSTNQYFRLHNP